MFKKIILSILFLIIGLILGAFVYLKQAVYEPLNPSEKQSQYFTLNLNEKTGNLAANLRSSGLIKSTLAFEFYSKIKKLKLQSGLYELSPSMSIATIANKISSGEVVKFTVTFPEGWSIYQMADRLEAKKIADKAEFIKIADGQEGYLFPDTYTFPSGTSVSEIIKMMKNNFKSRTKDLAMTPNLVILASIVEREASKNDDRSQIAAVYANRLKIGMRLQADPTVQFAKGSWAAITQSDYEKVISPYNTYLNGGLPPGPICNPGLASLEAAAKPAANDYFYFFYTKDGRTIFSKTYEEHSSQLNKYRSGQL